MGTTSTVMNNMIYSNFAVSGSAGYDKKNVKITWHPEELQTQKQISQTEYSIVVEAKHLKTLHTCAIKIIHYTNRDDPIYKYAIQKGIIVIEATNKLDHPNIVKTYVCQSFDVEGNFQIKSRFGIIMELYKENLLAYIQKRKKKKDFLNEYEILYILMQLSSALMYLESMGIYHHNIKLQNIFVQSDRHIKGAGRTGEDARKPGMALDFLGKKSPLCGASVTNSNGTNGYNTKDKSINGDSITNGNSIANVRFIIGDMDPCDDDFDFRKVDNKENVVYYSPEMTNSTFKHSLHKNIAKSDVFALGIIIVKIARLMDVFTIDDRESIIDLVNGLSIKYNRLYKILIKMLDKHPDKRCNFEEIFKYCQGHLFDLKILPINTMCCNSMLSVIQSKIKDKITENIKYKNAEDYRESLKCLDEAQGFIDNTKFVNVYDRILNAVCLQQKGIVYSKLKDAYVAIANYNKSIEIRRLYLNNFGLAECLYDLGCVYYIIEDYQQALIHLMKAYESYANPSVTLDSIVNDDYHDNEEDNIRQKIRYLDKIALTYEKLHDFENALEMHVLSLNEIKQAKGPSSQGYFKKLKSIVNCLRKSSQPQKAKELMLYLNDFQG